MKLEVGNRKHKTKAITDQAGLIDQVTNTKYQNKV